MSWGNNPSFSAGSVPPGLGSVRAIGAGYAHSLAVREDSTVAAWGGGSWNQGQLAVPAGLGNVVAVAGGSEHSLALRSDGTVVGWGNNLLGAGVPPAGLKSVVSVSAGFQHSAVLKADGTSAAWGCGFNGCTVPASASNLVQVAAGGYHTVGLKADGTVLAWTSGGIVTDPGLSNIVAVAGGGYHSLALRQDGTVYAWGTVFDGQDHGQTNIPAGLDQVVGIAAGIFHNLALKSDGTVVAWGYNAYGQCNVPPGLSNVVSLSGGGFHCLALVGSNGPSPGPSIMRQPVAAPVLQGTRVLCSVAARGVEPITYQWRRDGVAWPGATNAVLEFPSVTTNDTAVYSVVVSNAQGSSLSADAALFVLVPPEMTQEPAGTVAPIGAAVSFTAAASGVPEPRYQWRHQGSALAGQTNGTLTLNNVQVAQAGNYTLLASNLGGVVVSSNAVLMVDSPPVIQRPPTNSSAYVGDAVTLRVTATGTAALSYQWRFNDIDKPGETNAALTLSGLSTHDAGSYSVVVRSPFFSTVSATAQVTVVDAPPILLALPAQMTIFPGGSITLTGSFAGSKPLEFQWRFQGQPVAGGTNAALTLVNVSTQDAGAYSVAVSNRLGGWISPETVLVLVDVAAWGTVSTRGNQDIVPVGPVPAAVTNVIAVAQGGSHQLALKMDGTVLAWGDGVLGQTNVPPGLVNVVAIAAGGSHSLALRSDGQVVAWGDNGFRQSNVPAGLSNVVAIAAGSLHSLALRADGSVAAWGAGASGQIDVPPGLGSNMVAIAGGSGHSLALRSDGRVAAWGQNSSGQSLVPVNLSNVVAIAAGSAHSLAFKADGTPVGWGSNSLGQTNSPPSASNLVAIAAGGFHNLGLHGDGTVLAWGDGRSGQTNLPSGLSRVNAIAAKGSANLGLVGAPSPPLRASGLVASNGLFALTIPTRSGRVYALESRDTLDADNWVARPLVAGTGSPVILIDTNAAVAQRFYRVRSW